MIKESRLAVSLIFVMCLMLMVNCFVNLRSSKSKEAVVPVRNKKIVLGYSQIGDESIWRSANTLSVKSAAKEAGIEVLFSNAEQKQENQIKAIRSFIAQKVDVIAFAPIIETGWEEVLQEARDSGIQVIVLDRSIQVKDENLYTTYIGPDLLEEGRKAGRWLLENYKDYKSSINVVELKGTTGATPTILRSKGFKEIIQWDPNICIISSVNGDFIRSKGKEIMEALLKCHNEKIDVVYAHNDDMALGAIEAIEEYGLSPGDDIIIVSVDAVKPALEAIIEGRMNCSVECNPLQGQQLMKAVLNILDEKAVPKRIMIEEGIFTKENAARELPNRQY